MAVLQAGSTPPAVAAHGLFITPSADNPRLPRPNCLGLVLAPVLAPLRSSLARAFGRLRPAEFVQTVVVDAEVMGDLMDDGDRHLVDHLGLGLADVEQRLAVDRDRVG